ncbi:ROK family protein [Arthrobacter sp. zg-Y1171]|uniref:ROK family protein n=1 Tax=Arthrobacter sp. zg-Y1171 TaxID=2964610 RepID=UPI00210607F0|nr:ROK family protein [Arthrobacter sp. zg-Y1171]MCQ1994250.1 ROK family protein [Arthrobacter sp. zg-Y1171]UWX81652.1 ROK family protein [Arthrobacter sp. zg-Y1171]
MSLPAISLGAGSSTVLAFDVGGTYIKAGVVGPSGRLQAFCRVPTPLDKARPAEAVLDRIAELARDFRSELPESRIEAAGVIVPGIVDPGTGTAVYSANLGWRNYPFAEEAERRLGIPVAFGHDVAAAGDAELRLGGAKDFRDVLVIVIGTGIAAAVFCEGKRVTAGGYAGEIGQALVPAGSLTGTATLESVASAAAIARRYAAQAGHQMDGAREVADRALQGDAVARRVWGDAVDALAFSIAQCANILGTEAFIIGGGLSQAGDALLVPLRERLDRLLGSARRPHLLCARLGQDAGFIGAALNARELLLNRPARLSPESAPSGTA